MRAIFLILLVTTIFIGCTSDNKEEEANFISNLNLQEGDILFQDLDCGEMCDAIEGVTEGVNGRDFSHCALVVKDGDSLKVVEAIGGGVMLHTIKHFLVRSNDTAQLKNTVICRLKQQDRNLIKQASVFAKQQIGKEYDKEFIMDNGKYYCSELVYDAFKYGNNGNEIFDLAPMTFKGPESDSFMPVWVTYYKDLNKPIPEGEPGINPGLISRSKKLEVVE